MIVNERIVSYIHSLERDNSPILEEVAEYAEKMDVPIIRKEVEGFIRVLLEMKKPKKLLELGTAIGYSAILMSEYLDEGGTIVTIENYDKRIPVARENIKKAGKEKIITLIEGDALSILPNLEPSFDFVFMDAAKAQYINFLPHVMRLLDNQGILLADNVLQEGDIIESRYAVARRDRTIHGRMREFLYEIKHMENLTTAIIPIGDGMSLSIKRC
ncbi:MAG: O-methyltransferase [Lachnospiraceae bacterium]